MSAVITTPGEVVTIITANVGPQGPRGVGIQGERGETGNAFTLRGSVPTADDLPAADNEAGDAYLTVDDGHLHAWNGASWIDGGQIRGPQGIQGEQGIGIQGERGDTGNSFTLRGTVAGVAELPASSNEAGDAYLTIDDGHLYAWDGSAWIDGGQIRGPQGIQGVPGPSLNFRGNVSNAGDLPAAGNQPGDAITTDDDSHLHVWTATDEWLDLGPLQGPPGADGPAGRPFTLRGFVATAAELPAVDNQAGDAFAATDSGHLYAWNGAAWIDGGSVRGPQGEQGPAAVALPGGVDKQIQFNDGGALAGHAGLTYDKTTNTITLAGDIASTITKAARTSGAASDLTIKGGNGGNGLSDHGGSINLIAGPKSGHINITAGDAGTFATGGNISITAGASAGKVSITAGAGGAGAGEGGNIDIIAGNPTNGQGGSIFVAATPGAGPNMKGGNLDLNAGNSGGGAANGGNVSIRAGEMWGTGSAGHVVIDAGNGANRGSVKLRTGDLDRFVVNGYGAIGISGGSFGAVGYGLMSSGPTQQATWGPRPLMFHTSTTEKDSIPAGSITTLDLSTMVGSFARLWPAGAIQIESINAPTNRLIVLVNPSAKTITLSHDSPYGLDTGRFLCSGSANKVIPGGGSVTLWYDPYTLRWRPIASG